MNGSDVDSAKEAEVDTHFRFQVERRFFVEREEVKAIGKACEDSLNNIWEISENPLLAPFKEDSMWNLNIQQMTDKLNALQMKVDEKLKELEIRGVRLGIDQ